MKLFYCENYINLPHEKLTLFIVYSRSLSYWKLFLLRSAVYEQSTNCCFSITLGPVINHRLEKQGFRGDHMVL